MNLITFVATTAGLAAGFMFIAYRVGKASPQLISYGVVFAVALNGQMVWMVFQTPQQQQGVLPAVWAGNFILAIWVSRQLLLSTATPPARPLVDPAIAAEVAKHMRKRTCTSAGAAVLRLHLVSEHGDTADLLATDRVVTLAHGAKYPDCDTAEVWNETRVRMQLATLTAYLDLVTTERSPA